ncbi:MAG: hypothetical protein ACXWPI_17695, partial [Ktedonobacterales bacterium]
VPIIECPRTGGKIGKIGKGGNESGKKGNRPPAITARLARVKNEKLRILMARRWDTQKAIQLPPEPRPSLMPATWLTARTVRGMLSER